MNKESEEPVLTTHDMFGNEIDFATHEEVVRKARNVVSSWEKFFHKIPANQIDNSLSLALNAVNAYQQLESALSALGKKDSKTERSQLAFVLGQWMKAYDPVLDIESKQGRALNYLVNLGINRNPLAGTLQIALGGTLPSRIDDNIHASLSAYFGQIELNRLESENNPEVYSTLHTIDTTFQSMKQEVSAWLQEAKSQNDERLQKFSDSGIEQIEAYTAKASNLLEQLEKDAEQAEATANALEQQHQLKQPALYWSDKRDQHKNRRVIYAAVAGIWFLVGSIAAIWLAVSGWPLIPTTVSEGEELVVWPYLLLMGKGLLLVTLYLWIARILVRLFLSEVHLTMDADQRITMTESYLAMVNEGAIGTDPTHASKILEALFRPTQDGIVKDDASSDPMMSVVLQRIAKGK